MIKPINMKELVLRVEALLRRAKIHSEKKIVVGSTVLDYDALTVTIHGAETTLPQKEFYLLYKLLSYPNKIFTRPQLMDEIWGMFSETDERTVNTHINRLRDRFSDCTDFEIVTVRGLGYKAVKNGNLVELSKPENGAKRIRNGENCFDKEENNAYHKDTGIRNQTGERKNE
jgi:DNA-binding response OmpR family regulator